RHLVAWLLLVVAWVNMHSLFLVGVNLVLAGLLGVVLSMLMTTVRPCAVAPGRRPLLVSLAVAVVLGLLAALFNPDGPVALLRFFESSGNSAMWRVTDEWSHFTPFSPEDSEDVPWIAWLLADIVMAAFLVTALAAFVDYVRRPSEERLRRFSPVLFGISLAAVAAMLAAIRFLWLGWLPALYALRWLALVLPARPVAVAGLGWLAALGVLALAVRFLGIAPLETVVARFAAAPSEWLTLPYRSHKYYAEGVHFLQRTHLDGNVFNVYWMGGFLGYWRGPANRTFIDGRTEHYDVSVFDDYAAIGALADPKGGGTVLDALDRRGVDLFFGVGFQGSWHPLFTTPFLERAPGWLLVSRSFRHAIYLRDVPRNAERLARVAAFYAAEGVPFDPARGLDPDRVVRERPDFAVRERLVVPQHAD
ncbi:MAG: hypothetical protein KDC48_22690, partial [Planctomycetes bacterium]|nr:hypothetical protein [Planctomycetota bacterium]